MFLGIDLGTSSVKATLIDDAGVRIHESAAPLDVSRPRPTWSEQDPGAWWLATLAAVQGLRRDARAAVRGIGLTGQMHGAVLMDAHQRVLRPAILWNDGRAADACVELERREPASRVITGNLAMPGFTAPKLLWIAAHEPEHFRRIDKVLLPKDWLRWKLTNEFVSDPSDAAGTLWLDVARRCWSTAMLAACELDQRQMPRLVEGIEVSAQLVTNAASELGLPAGVPVVGGGSDNACGAVGVGVVNDADALLSLGTSGVIFVADRVLRPDPVRAVHAFCHCVPSMWHRMAVILSAAETLSFVTRLTGTASESALLRDIEVSGIAAPSGNRLVMLPYLSGERTPHNNAAASGVVFGLDDATSRADLGRAALEGVAFALADAIDVLDLKTMGADSLCVIGGGARSRAWGSIIAAALGRRLAYPADAEAGPAVGAARLARIAVERLDITEGCPRPVIAAVIDPDPRLAEAMAPRRALFRRLYAELVPVFDEARASARGVPTSSSA